MSAYTKPLPVPSPESQPFWDGARAHRLTIPNCSACGNCWFPPSTLCPGCGSADHGWIDASGRGRVHSFVTYHRLYHPGWEGEIPYVVAIVELEEGARLYANIVDIPVDDVRCDMAVEAIFDDVTEEVTLVKFRPV